MEAAVLQIHPDDDLLIALRPLSRGEVVHINGHSLTIDQDVPAKHQITTRDLAVDDAVRLYGVTVGRVTAPVSRGGRMTTENLVHLSDGFENQNQSYTWTAPDISKHAGKQFMGYHRADGRVGTANHWLVVPLVFCENQNLNTLRDAFLKELGYDNRDGYRRQVSRLADLYRDGKSEQEILDLAQTGQIKHGETNRLFPNVDGIKFLAHQLGCGGMTQDALSLCGLMAGYINHPNVGGATVLSLGCQKAQIGILQEKLEAANPNLAKPVIFLEQQDFATEEDFIGTAINQTFVGMMRTNQTSRQPAGVEQLTIGVECGASDGFSGISANPCIGALADRIVGLGGSVILSEFPELCGVEQELVNRCAKPAVADRFIELMRSYASRAEALGEGLDSNPSPGNIKDGLITDAIKSAGAARKGGSSPIVDVQDYPGQCRAKGLSLLCTPGNDIESTTAMAGAGANLILFSTGLGTPTGNPITPVIKVATNTELTERMRDIIDYNAGQIIDGTRTLDEAADDLLDLALKVASGEVETCAGRLGQDDFIPWKRGESL